ncbi:hypothetical protein L228DRAFT_254250 [Xylona heveae TC161]|uniref:Uncharacterized protein n=1 Tax=Xylona heveae (strain CBS 132557 / TC161) TaxID=1328760 RepID=A0A164ZVF9_XYLHT|nr:hypothetical protein L228DRAFT_254250 [Xylona heveae TC161]KZF19583.1 hypothetical protein L228DRAFT_254250 [Xylona heveae TC161]
MVSHRRRDLANGRRRVEDEGEEEGSVAGEVEEDSMSEASAFTDHEDDADADDSDLSEADGIESLEAEEVKAKANGHVASKDEDGHAEEKRSPKAVTGDTEVMMNGLVRSDNVNGAEEFHFDELGDESSQPQEGVASQESVATKQETLTDRRRREHEEYRRKRDEDPAFVPNRGGFFMHDHRTSAPGQNGFRPFGRGKGRTRGGLGGPVSINPNPQAQEATDSPWTHDLHETVADAAPRALGPHATSSNGAPNTSSKPSQPAPKPSSPPKNSFSTTTHIGNVQIRVLLPGMANPIAFSAVPVKQHTRLPEHRPPLRRDKPVRISLPDNPPHYIFPAMERSFIFIPRALRPNQQGFGRVRGRPGMPPFGGFSSRRTSMYGGSVYAPSAAMSRRSSLAREVPRDAIISPTGSTMSRAPAVLEAGKPVVRLPPTAQPVLPPDSLPPRPEMPMPEAPVPVVNLPQPQAYPLPQRPAFRENRTAPLPMHQPRPQKTVSVADIESPAGIPFTHPPQQQQQPFHQQVPLQVNGQTYSADVTTAYPQHPRSGSFAAPASAATPLSHLPERAIHAQPFQPQQYTQQPYYPAVYPPQGVYYYPAPAPDGSQPAYAPTLTAPAAAPVFVPSPQQNAYLMPAAPAPPVQNPSGTVAHESNGMVYYYDSSQIYMNPGDGYAGASYGVPASGMGSMMSMASISNGMDPETPITIKVAIDGTNRRFKLPLKDLSANVLPFKLRHLLSIPPTHRVFFERYSDSAGAFMVLDPANPSVYKQLYRAAKAKLKLRIRATVVPETPETSQQDKISGQESAQEPSTSSDLLGSAAAMPSPEQSTPASQSNNSVQLPITTPASVAPPVLAPATTPEQASQDDDLKHIGAELVEQLKRMGHDQENLPLPPPYNPPSAGERERFYATLAHMSKERELGRRTQEAPAPLPPTWSVYCNNCDKVVNDAHYHCGICDNGDFDLCLDCIDAGVVCAGEGHWLVKRFVRNGQVITGQTEICPPKKKMTDAGSAPTAPVIAEEKTVPSAQRSIPSFYNYSYEKAPEPVATRTRICNSCVEEYAEDRCVTCTNCEDFDLCLNCHTGNRHGHHPCHGFKPATSSVELDPLATALCAPGRNTRHFAICDGCDKTIYGVRHKCLSCPDWDFCSNCIKTSRASHPGHRFVPIYEQMSLPSQSKAKHMGVYCDGPLCRGKPHQSYIVGDRFKCAVCHDTDFCANCEAFPANKHNRTHPLLKFKTPVRSVCVTTMHADKPGEEILQLGDKPVRMTSTSTETEAVATTSMSSTASAASSATTVQTVADLKPTEESLSEKVPAEVEEKEQVAAPCPPVVRSDQLNAHFIRDVVADGSKVPANKVFKQTWTLRNPGPHAWPAGCSVRYVGGDNMLNIDAKHPSTIADVSLAIESNKTTEEVSVGEMVDFSLVMKAPPREGKAISYWRLKAADNTPFGHKLWCDIDVYAEEPEPIKEEQEGQATPKAAVEPIDVSIVQDKTEESSTMIFPKLDKESPVSSTHEAAAPLSPTSTDQKPDTPKLSSDADEQDLLEDIESLELGSDEHTEDGFLTDEEYDVLDASDEEILSEGKVSRK